MDNGQSKLDTVNKKRNAAISVFGEDQSCYTPVSKKLKQNGTLLLLSHLFILEWNGSFISIGAQAQLTSFEKFVIQKLDTIFHTQKEHKELLHLLVKKAEKDEATNQVELHQVNSKEDYQILEAGLAVDSTYIQMVKQS